jgi:hypothetical protein
VKGVGLSGRPSRQLGGRRRPDKIVHIRAERRLYINAAAQTLGELRIVGPMREQEFDICYVLISLAPEPSRRSHRGAMQDSEVTRDRAEVSNARAVPAARRE